MHVHSKMKAYKISKKKLCSKVLGSHNYSQIKLHSKVIFSDLVGFLFFVEFNGEGQNSNRNTVKHTAENGRKNLGDEDAAGITSLVPGVKNSRLRNGLEFDWAY